MRGWLAALLIDRQGINWGLIQFSDKYEGVFTAQDERRFVNLEHPISMHLETLWELRNLQQAAAGKTDHPDDVSAQHSVYEALMQFDRATVALLVLSPDAPAAWSNRIKYVEAKPWMHQADPNNSGWAFRVCYGCRSPG